MSSGEPPRHRDDPTLPAEWRQALDAARQDGPGRADRDRLRASVLAAVGGTAALSTATTASAAAGGTAAATATKATATAGIGLGAKLVVGTLVVSGAITGTYVAVERASEPPAPRTAPATDRRAPGSTHAAGRATRAETPAVRVAPQPEPEPPAALPAPAAEPASPSSEPKAAASPGAAHEGAAGLGAPRDAMDELGLIRNAHDALDANPRRALALAARHRREFPHGVFAQEREVMAIEALQRLGRTSQARARSERFLARFPHSSHAPRIRRILAGAPERKEQLNAP